MSKFSILSKFIDIHTHNLHNLSSDTNALTLKIFVANMETIQNSPSIRSKDSKELLCLGIHPWLVDKLDYNLALQTIKNYINDPNFFALGEIGLDKVCSCDYNKQKHIFSTQLDLAKTFKIPRIIIHSVKAHSDILYFLKEKRITQNILIHDFYGAPQTALQYLNKNAKFRCYFSFGTKLFHHEKAIEAFRSLPINRVFLETDDQVDYTIFDIYQRASNLLGVSMDRLKYILYQNYLEFIKVSH